MPLKHAFIHGWHCQILLQVGNIVFPSLPWRPHSFIKFCVLALEFFLKAGTWEKRRPLPILPSCILSSGSLLCWRFPFHKLEPLMGGLLPSSHLVHRRRVAVDDLDVFNNCKCFVLWCSQFCLDASPHGAAQCLLPFTELLAFSHRRSGCLWWEITGKTISTSCLEISSSLQGRWLLLNSG